MKGSSFNSVCFLRVWCSGRGALPSFMTWCSGGEEPLSRRGEDGGEAGHGGGVNVGIYQ